MHGHRQGSLGSYSAVSAVLGVGWFIYLFCFLNIFTLSVRLSMAIVLPSLSWEGKGHFGLCLQTCKTPCSVTTHSVVALSMGRKLLLAYQ